MELTDLQLTILVCVYFFGVVSCKFATQFFEVCHAARLVERTMYRCLLMCAKVHEDAAFLREIKYNHLKTAEFESSRIRDFMAVDDRAMTHWKESIIQSILINTPPTFSYVTKFTNWKEAMQQLKEMPKDDL